MTQQISQFLSQPILGGLGLLLTLVFGLLSLVLYVRQRQQKDLRYCVKDDYSARFNASTSWRKDFAKFLSEKKLEESDWEEGFGDFVTIWNQGKATIEASAISGTDPLSISVGTGLIQHAYVYRQKKFANGAKIVISEDRRSVRVTFDFLDWRDGIEIGIAGIWPKQEKQQNFFGKLRGFFITDDSRIELMGTVMGVNKIRRLTQVPHAEDVSVIISLGIICVSAIIGMLFSVGQLFKRNRIVAFDAIYGAPFIAICFCIAIIWLLFLLWHYRHSPRNRSHWHLVATDHPGLRRTW